MIPKLSESNRSRLYPSLSLGDGDIPDRQRLRRMLHIFGKSFEAEATLKLNTNRSNGTNTHMPRGQNIYKPTLGPRVANDFHIPVIPDRNQRRALDLGGHLFPFRNVAPGTTEVNVTFFAVVYFILRRKFRVLCEIHCGVLGHSNGMPTAQHRELISEQSVFVYFCLDTMRILYFFLETNTNKQVYPD